MPIKAQRQFTPQQRSNINLPYSIADSNNDEQDPITITSPRHININMLDVKSNPSPQSIIEEVAPYHPLSDSINRDHYAIFKISMMGNERVRIDTEVTVE